MGATPAFTDVRCCAIGSAPLGGVDALPAFTGRTVSGGRLNVLR
jgi:hypothetical protein